MKAKTPGIHEFDNLSLQECKPQCIKLIDLLFDYTANIISAKQLLYLYAVCQNLFAVEVDISPYHITLERAVPEGVKNHSTAVLFSINDSRNAEHNLVRGGRLCDDPLNMVSQGLSDRTDGTNEVLFLFFNSGNSP